MDNSSTQPYERSIDGATMVAIAPHVYVNAAWINRSKDERVKGEE